MTRRLVNCSGEAGTRMFLARLYWRFRNLVLLKLTYL